jgi:hypothetical protein
MGRGDKDGSEGWEQRTSRSVRRQTTRHSHSIAAVKVPGNLHRIEHVYRIENGIQGTWYVVGIRYGHRHNFRTMLEQGGRNQAT